MSLPSLLSEELTPVISRRSGRCSYRESFCPRKASVDPGMITRSFQIEWGSWCQVQRCGLISVTGSAGILSY